MKKWDAIERPQELADYVTSVVEQRRRQGINMSELDEITPAVLFNKVQSHARRDLQTRRFKSRKAEDAAYREFEEREGHLEDILAGIQTRIKRVLSPGIHGAFNHFFDIESDADKKTEIIKYLTECLDIDFNLFWGVLKVVSGMSDETFFDDRNPDSFLRWNMMLAECFITALRQHPNHEQFERQILQNCKITGRHGREREDTFFQGASIARTLPLFERFGKLCDHKDHSANVFGKLISVLDDFVVNMTDGKQRGYPIRSASSGWDSLIAAIRKIHPNIRIFAPTNSYINMLSKDRKNLTIVESQSTESIWEKISDAIKQDESGAVPIVLIPSALRDGTRTPDINTSIARLKAEHPNAIIVIDAAQDHVFYPEADCVLYSKRLGGTSTGVAAVGEDMPKEIHDAFSIVGGYRTSDIARAYAALFYTTSTMASNFRFANHFSELLATPELWNFKGQGTYISGLCAMIEHAVAELFNLKKSLEITYADLPKFTGASGRKTEVWNSHRIITFRKKPGCNFSMRKLAEGLARSNPMNPIRVDWYSFKEPPADKRYEELVEMGKQPYSEEHCKAFFQALRKFEKDFAAYLMNNTLTLPEVFNGTAEPSEDLYQRQIQRFLEQVDSQEMIRIFIDILMTTNDIKNLLKSLDDTLIDVNPELAGYASLVQAILSSHLARPALLKPAPRVNPRKRNV